MAEQLIINTNEMIVRYNEIKTAVKTLNTLWPNKVIQAISWKIPIALAENKDQKADTIDVIPLHAQQRINAALKAFTQFESDPYQDPSTVMRHPGLLFLSEIAEVKQQVDHINTLKDGLPP